MSRGRRPEHSREKILEIGAELFTRNGYHATGIKEILAECGVPKGSFYNFFASKEHFAVEIIQHYQSIELERWTEQLERQQGSHFEKINMILQAETERYSNAESGTCGCLLANLSGEVSQASPMFKQAILDSINRVIQDIERDIQICQDEGSVRTDIEAKAIAEIIWDNWQGSLLRSKVLDSVEPLRNHQLTFMKLIAR